MSQNAETAAVIDQPITELERELLCIIRNIDAGYCLGGVLLGNRKALRDRLFETMRQVAPIARSETSR